MALPTYGLLGAGSAMLQAPPGQGIGQTVGQGLSGFLSGLPADAAAQRTAQKRKTLEDVAAQWRAGAQQLASQHAVPISYLSRVATVESNNRNVPQSVNDTGSAFGPFQFTSGTWKDQITRHPELGLTEQDRFNPAAQGRVAVTFTRDNRDQLRTALGRDPTPGDLLLAHRFGAEGAISLLRTPRNESVAKVMPTAASANPQWQQLTVGQIIDNTQKSVMGDAQAKAQASGGERLPRGGGGLMGSSPTPSTGSSTDGLAALFGGMQLAPAGANLADMTPEFRNILATALSDPTLGPMALQAIIQAGLSGGGGGSAKPKVTDEITNAIAAGYRPGTPEWDRVVGKAPGPEKPKTTDIMAEAQSLYPNDPAAQRKFIEDYRAKAGVKVDINQPASPNPVVQEDFKNVIDTGRAAVAGLSDIERGRIALKNLPTGAGQELRAKAQMWVKALGLDPSIIGPDITTQSQLLASVAVPLALKIRQAGTGQMSDREQSLYQSATIGLGNTPEANEFILDAGERIFKRQLEERKFATKFVKQQGGVTIDFPDAIDTFRSEHPIFDESFYKKWEPRLMQSATPAAEPSAAVPAPAAGPPTINDQKAYDALPSGTTYQSGGKLYRKP